MKSTAPSIRRDALHRLWRRALRERRFRLEPEAAAESLDLPTLDRAIAGLAARWRAAGAAAGEVVVLRATQGLPVFLGFWAAQRLGLVALMVDSASPPARLAALAEAGAARWQMDAAGDGLTAPAGLALLPSPQAGQASVAETQSIGVLPDEDWASVANPAIAALLPTSGSTGTPKLVALSRAALARSALLAVRAFGWAPGERLLNLAEPHTMSGLRNALLAAPLGGLHWLASPPDGRADLFALFDEIHSRRPQHLVAAPLLVRQANLWRSRLPADLWAGVQAVYCTGADLDAAEVQRFHAAERIPVLNYYGLTETVGLCLSQSRPGWTAEDRSLGRPVGCRVRLIGEAGEAIRPGADAIGELQVRQRWPSAGYWRQPEASRALFTADGWLATGDLARIDAQGRVHLVGRRAHFIKTAGTEKVAPAEVEQALERHPAVLEAAVCGERDSAGLERIAALLVLRAGQAPASAAEGTALRAGLIAHVAGLLGAARAPSRVCFVHHLPRAANGKLLRPQLPSLLEP